MDEAPPHERLAPKLLLSRRRLNLRANGDMVDTRRVRHAERPKRILIVEDDELLSAFYKSLFNRMKDRFSAALADTGESALQKLKLQPFDAVVLDWDLPGMSGLRILKALRANPATRCLPVIMISGRSAPEDQVSALESGADDFISKPFPVEVFLARLAALLRRAEF